jgi:hypothetical protein
MRPKSVAYVENLIAVNPGASEAEWKKVEDRLPEVLRALKDGSLLTRLDLIEVAKDCIALHWARSHTMRGVWARLRGKQLAGLKSEFFKEVTPEGAFLTLTGLYAPGPGVARQYVERYIEAHWDKQFADGSFFAERVHANFTEARRRVARYQLQVAQAIKSQFVIGDNPALSVATGRTGVGPLQGVTWEAADTIVMPVAPRYVLGLGPSSDWLKLNGVQAERLNSIQGRGFFRHLMFRPRSFDQRKIERRFRA